jgi:hypothetical protein
MTIISFEKKFVFIKTKKVAGTSVEALLRKFTGDNDIVPAVTPRDELYSAKQDDFSKNYLKNKSNEIFYTELVMSGDYDKAVDFLSKQKRIAFSHMDYEGVINLLKRLGEDPSRFYYFTIDRHPYSWLLSSALYNNTEYNLKGKVDLKLNVAGINQVVERFLNQDEVEKKINWGKYTYRDEVMVDKVIDYDDLSNGLEKVFKYIGVSENDSALPDLKNSSRHLSAHEILSDKNKGTAQNVFSSLFSYMEYYR